MHLFFTPLLILGACTDTKSQTDSGVDTEFEQELDGDSESDSGSDNTTPPEDTHTNPDTAEEPNSEDEDEDGFSPAQGDCDDNNILISPFVTDLVGNEIDDNCDGVDGTDLDGDGSANILSGGDDCDDSDSILNNIDVDGDYAELYFDGTPIYNWLWSEGSTGPSNTIAALNLYPNEFFF